jgi:hypothetical protein
MGNIDRIGRQTVILTPAGKVTDYLVALFSLERLGEAKLKARSLASRQYVSILIFDAKLWFALLALQRTAIFSENKASNKLVTLPAGVKQFQFFIFDP